MKKLTCSLFLGLISFAYAVSVKAQNAQNRQTQNQSETPKNSQNSQNSQTLPDSSKVFLLGQVTVLSPKKDSLSIISSRETRDFQKLTVATALNLMPGITQSNVGPRNESMIYLRGFDLRQTPVFVDGIPIYVPYDGYVDLARFTTFNLSRIIVEKGGASVLYGPNTMGGVINLVTAKPVNKFELDAGGGWVTGGHEEYLNMGSRIKKFYIQADLSRYERDYYNLSKSFTPTKTQGSGNRGNSYNDDWKYGFKIGFVPNNKNEFAIGFNHQDGTKGTSVYTGMDTLNSLYKNPRYWQWPAWNEQSVYFLSESGISRNSYFKSRVFYDQFINTLKSFDNATYTTQTKPYAFTSYYNDYTFGGNLEYGQALSGTNMLKTAFHFKQDVHREHNEGERVRRTADNTFSIGVTDHHTFDPNWSVEAGGSFNHRQSLEAQNYNSTTHTITDFPKNNNSAFNVQGKLFYTFIPNRTLEFNAGRMTRFATIKDRYSYRLGTAIPNPDLHAEKAVNLSLQYNDITIEKWNFQGSIFYSRINNVIQNVNNVAYDSVKHQWLSQQQNKGSAEFYGGEASVSYTLSPVFKGGLNYSYIKRKNLNNPSIRFTDVPGNKATGWAKIQVSRFTLLVNGEYNTSRYSTSYGTQAPAFFLLHANLTAGINKWIKLKGGVNNIFDKNYMLTEGYPEQGRNYFVKLLVHFAYF